MIQSFIRNLFPSDARAHRRCSSHSVVAAEVLEQRILLAGDTYWDDAAVGSHDFGHGGNWTNGQPIATNPAPGVPDVGIFRDFTGVVDVSDQRQVGDLDFRGTNDIDVNFANSAQLDVETFNVGKMFGGPLDKSDVTIKTALPAIGETSLIATAILIGTESQATLTLNKTVAQAETITMGEVVIGPAPPGGWFFKSKLTIDSQSTLVMMTPGDAEPSLIGGEDSDATLDIQGTLSDVDRTSTFQVGANNGGGPAALGAIKVDGGTMEAGHLTIGLGTLGLGLGSMFISNGGNVDVGTVVLGDGKQTMTDGIVTIESNGELWVDGDVHVAKGGKAQFTVGSSAEATIGGKFLVGNNNGTNAGMGEASIQGTLTSTEIAIGNDKATGTLHIVSSAQISTNKMIVGVGGKGTVTMSNDSTTTVSGAVGTAESTAVVIGKDSTFLGKVVLKDNASWVVLYKDAGGDQHRGLIKVGSATSKGVLQVDNDATVDADVTAFEKGKVSGDKKILGKVTTKKGAKVKPGANGGLATLGLLTVGGDWNASDGGTLFVDLGAVGAPGIDYDQLVLESDADLGGTLEVDLINGFIPNTVYDFGVDYDMNVLNGASVFEVVSIGGNRTNEFESFNPPEQQLPAGMTWKVHHGDLDGDGDDGVWVMVVQGDAPVAVADEYNTTHDQTLDTLAQFHPALLDNDYDPNGDSLDAVIDAYPANGTITWFDGDTGHFIYEPAQSFVGSDYFTYQATDGTNSSYTATVTINVTNNAPITGDDSYFINHDTTLNEYSPGVLANDWDDDFDTLSAVLVDDVQNGTLVLNSDGSFDYTPAQNFVGFDYFTYAADDGFEQALATVTIEVYNDEPFADDDYYDTDLDTPRVEGDPGVMWNDFDTDPLTAYITSLPANGTLVDGAGNPLSIGSSFGGGFTYTPNLSYQGLDYFTYYVSDGIANSPDATVTIDVYDMSGGGGPGGSTSVVANDDYVWAWPDQTHSVNAPGVMGNDSTTSATAILVSQAANGVATLNADGSYTYVPNQGYEGVDYFTYHLVDGSETSNVATVEITVDDWQPLEAAGKEIEHAPGSQSPALLAI